MKMYEVASAVARSHLAGHLPRANEYLMGMDAHPTAAFKMIELWHTLREFQPRTILEVGCGATTCIFALYAKETGAKVISTEDKPQYRDACLGRLKELSEYVSIELVPLVTGDTVHHDYTPTETPDLLYVDGPATLNGEICSDATNLVASGMYPRCIMWDFRYKSLKEFSDRYADLYWFQVGWAGNPTLWYTAKHHSFAWRW